MNRITTWAGALLGAFVFSQAHAQDRIRIGFIPTTTVQAQVAHTLDKTDILNRHGLEGEAILLNSSPAVNEALVAGAIDVGFVSDFAAITVMAAGAPIVAIGHQSNFRGAVMVAADSSVETISDLEGKTVYGLFGVTVYQSAIEMVRTAGLTPGEDVTFVNMGFSELADALRAGRVEAFFTWDPWIAFFEKEGLARTIEQDVAGTMVIMARESFVEQEPKTVAKFLRAHAEALYFAAQNKDLSNAWFRLPEAARQLDVDVVETATAFDPNWTAESFEDISIGFTPEQIDRLTSLAQFAFDNNLTQRLAPIVERTNVEIGAAVEQEKADKPFDVDAVTVTAEQ